MTAGVLFGPAAAGIAGSGVGVGDSGATLALIDGCGGIGGGYILCRMCLLNVFPLL